MADFKLRMPDDLAARFDAWAAARGGRSPALRRLAAEACDGVTGGPRLGLRSAKLTVRLSEGDAASLDKTAREMGLTPNGWAAAMLRRRLTGRLTFSPGELQVLLDIQRELRRIGVNINQIARALNTAVIEGRVLDLELGEVAAFKREIREHLAGLRDVMARRQVYWDLADE